MNKDEDPANSKRRLDATSSGMNTQIGVERGPKSEDALDVEDLPDDPDVLKSRIERLEREIQHLLVLSGGADNTPQSTGEQDDEVETEISGTLETLNTQLSERLESIEADISSLEEQHADESVLERYNVAAILLQIQFIVGAFFIMLNFINAATAGGIALLFSTLLQFGHKIYAESGDSSTRSRQKRGRL